MVPLHTFLALAPLAIYLSLLGLINLSRRPFLTTGTRDLYALGVAISGLMVVGPLDLFMPESAALWGGFLWVLLLAFYALCLTLVVLVMRPRLVIYNITLDQLRPVLADLMTRLQLDHQWAGESLALPGLGVQLQLERFGAMRNVALVATASDQSYYGWRRLERELGAELRSLEVAPNRVGMLMLSISALFFCGSLAWLILRREEVAQGFIEMLRL